MAVFSTSLAALFTGISIGFTVIYTDFEETQWQVASLWAILAFVIFALVFAGVSILASFSLSRRISKRVNSINFDAPDKSKLPLPQFRAMPSLSATVWQKAKT